MPLNLTRSLLVILIPGGIMLAPWLLWLVSQEAATADLYNKYPQLVWAALFASATVAGTVLEGVNSHIEVKWDELRDEEFQVQDNWYDYLARVCPTEPVARSYLSRMYTTMYFELAMLWAGLSFGAGMIMLILSKEPSRCVLVASLALGTVAFSAWMLISAYESHKVLCQTRKAVNLRLEAIAPTRSASESK